MIDSGHPITDIVQKIACIRTPWELGGHGEGGGRPQKFGDSASQKLLRPLKGCIGGPRSCNPPRMNYPDAQRERFLTQVTSGPLTCWSPRAGCAECQRTNGARAGPFDPSDGEHVGR